MPLYGPLSPEEAEDFKCPQPESATAELPIEPRCIVEYRIVMAAEALGELSASVRAHRLTCPLCNGTRKPPMSQTAPVERKVAA